MTEYVITHGYARNGKFIKGLCTTLTYTNRESAVKAFIKLYDAGLNGIDRFASKAAHRRLSNHFKCKCQVFKDGKYNSTLTTNFLMQSLCLK